MIGSSEKHNPGSGARRRLLRCLLGGWIGWVLLPVANAQQLPNLPKNLPGVVSLPHLMQAPTKTVKPIYPPDALQHWIQATIVLDVVLDTNGDVENLGCDAMCNDARADMIQAAAAAVRQWHWNPVMLKGQPIRVRTRVPVNFVLDASSPPISVCNVLSDPQRFKGQVVNMIGTVEHVAGVNVMRSEACPGSIVIAEHGDATPPDVDAKYAVFQQALAAGPATAAIRGLVRDGGGEGQLVGLRLVLQRVLQVSSK